MVEQVGISEIAVCFSILLENPAGHIKEEYGNSINTLIKGIL